MANAMSWISDKLQEEKVESVYRISNSYPKPDTYTESKVFGAFHNQSWRLITSP